MGKNLPDLTRVRYMKNAQPVAPIFTPISRPCSDCRESNLLNDAFAAARFDPRNRTGQPGVDLFSQNFNWSKTLVDLPGRAKLNLQLALVYNSLVWTRAGSQISFDADRGQPSPGFRLGFPTIQPRRYDARTGKNSYLLITPEGGRVELRQVGDSTTYEAADASLLQMIDQGTDGASLRRPDGAQLSFRPIDGQLQCTEVKDRNGNYITVGYNKRGHMSRITDTLGRTLVFVHDKGGNLVSITQEENGAGKRVLATFGYSELAIQPNFAELELVGLTGGTTVPVLTQLGLPDGSRYQFDYTSWGQIRRITQYAADGHALAYTSFNLPQDSGAVLTDCPRLTEQRNWIENSNDGLETVTRFDLASSGAVGQATLPDGTTRKEFFGTTGWQRGLILRTEDRDANGALQKSVSTEWSQQGTDGSYRVVPTSQELVSSDAQGGQQRTRTEFTDWGLPRDVRQYAADGSLIQSTHTEYNLDAVYTEKRTLGLISEQTVYDSNDAMTSKTTYAYDLADGLVDHGSAVQHDTFNYGVGFVTGRGLLSAIRRSDTKESGGEAKIVETRLGYNTTGSIAFTSTPSGGVTSVTYGDNFADGKDRGTLAFATAATHPDGKQTLTQYDYNTGSLVWTQDSKGVAQTASYDAAGRVIATTNLETGSSARRVYDESGTLVATFIKVKATTKEFGSYEIRDGAKRVRARAFDPLSNEMGYKGVYIARDKVGRITGRTRPAKMNASWVVKDSRIAFDSVEPRGQKSGIEEVASSIERFGDKLLAGLDRLASAIEPTATACYDPYYGGCGGDPYYNNCFTATSGATIGIGIGLASPTP